MTDHTTEKDVTVAVRDLLHPIIEGVGLNQRCRWQMHTLCPAYHRAQVAAEAMLNAGLLVIPPGKPGSDD